MMNKMYQQLQRPNIHNYNDLDLVIENMYLGNLNAASDINKLKKLVSIINR